MRETKHVAQSRLPVAVLLLLQTSTSPRLCAQGRFAAPKPRPKAGSRRRVANPGAYQN